MKKQNIFFAVTLAAIMILTACNGGGDTKDPKLANELDSLNYTYGLAFGNDLKTNLFNKDSVEQKTKSFMKGLAEGSKGEADAKPGLSAAATQYGDWLKQQKTAGFLGDSTLKLNFNLFKQGLINGLNNSKIQMTPQEANEYINKVMNARQEIVMMKQFGKNKEAGDKFLAENGKKPGVVTTASGLQYEVIKKGTGPVPTATDQVKVHYVGTLLDGTEFDSSIKRNEPAMFPVNQVIPGWTEGLQLMPVGSKYKFYIPQNLAYGSKGARGIEPLSTLVFEVELLSIEK